MEVIQGLGYLGFVISVACIFGISYHKTRIRELTFAVGKLILKIDELEKEIHNGQSRN